MESQTTTAPTSDAMPTNAELLAAIHALADAQTLAAKNVLTYEETAKITGYSVTHLKKLVYANKIPCYRPNGKKVFFNRAEVENWLMQNPQNTAQEATKADVLNRYING